MQFFDSEGLYPQLNLKIMEEMRQLDNEDLLLLLTISRHLRQKQGK